MEEYKTWNLCCHDWKVAAKGENGDIICFGYELMMYIKKFVEYL